MNILLFFTLLLFSVFFCFANKKSMLNLLKNSSLPVFGLFTIIAIIIYPKAAVSSALTGIHLWLDIVFPSLFPFFVASQLLSKSGFINIFGTLLDPVMRPVFNVPGAGSFALAMGVVSGYPMGASITSDLRKQNILTRTEAERLLTFTNNSGPLFIMGAVAVGLFKSPIIGYLLYISHVAACLTVGFIFRFYKKSRKTRLANDVRISQKLKLELLKFRNSEFNPWVLFGECIKNSMFTILTIGGFIIFFSVFINILRTSGIIGFISSFAPQSLSHLGITPTSLEGILCGLFEITTGSNIISGTAVDLQFKLCAVSLIIGWAGFSVHAQVMSIVSSSDISVKPYIIGKALQGLISSIYTYIGYIFFMPQITHNISVFSNMTSRYFRMEDILANSLQRVIVILLIMGTVLIAYVFGSSLLQRKRLL